MTTIAPSAAGIAAAWSAARTDQTRDTVALAAVKAQAQAEQAVAVMVEEGVANAAPPPPGQGRLVDVRA